MILPKAFKLCVSCRLSAPDFTVLFRLFADICEYSAVDVKYMPVYRV